MKISRLKLTNFRSYESLCLDFGENVIIVGSNAQGKTNLLEAAHLISVGKSFRGKELEILKWGNSFFRVEADISRNDTKKIEYIYEKIPPRDRKTIKLNGIKKPSSALLGALQGVFFSPDEIDDFLGFPGARRRYFNILCSQFFKPFALALVRYSRALEQRNALLRQIAAGRASDELLALWDGKIAEYGVQIITDRLNIIEELNKEITRNYQELSQTEDEITLEYKSTLKKVQKDDLWGGYLEALLQSQSKDKVLGVTSIGPHRDDFLFVMNGRNITEFGSRGEYRTAILALKFSQLDLVRRLLARDPILLLDDVFSELDKSRRRSLLDRFSGHQTIVTTTDLDHIEPDFRKKADIYEVTNSILKKI